MIKAILFDVDGVLIDSFESNMAFFTTLLTKNGYKAPTLEAYTPTFHMTMKGVIAHLTQSESDEEIERIWEMGAKRIVPYPSHLINMPDNVEEVIEQLSQNYILGIVTSRVKIGVEDVPLLVKLREYFKVIVTYEDTENHKPLPDPLLFAVKKLNLDPSECLYIGDTQSDVEAALAANMKAITYPTLLKGASGSFAHFNELPAIVKSLQ